MAKKTMKAESISKSAGAKLTATSGLMGAVGVKAVTEAKSSGTRTMTGTKTATVNTQRTMTGTKTATVNTQRTMTGTQTATVNTQRTMTGTQTATVNTQRTMTGTKTATADTQRTMTGTTTATQGGKVERDPAKTSIQRPTGKELTAATGLMGTLGVKAVTEAKNSNTRTMTGSKASTMGTQRVMKATDDKHGAPVERDLSKTTIQRTNGSVASTAGIMASVGTASFLETEGNRIEAFDMPGLSILGQLAGMSQLFGMSQGVEGNRLYDMSQMPIYAPVSGFTNPQADEKGEPVTFNNLCVLNFPAMRLETFEITNKVNEHARLHFTGFIEDDGSHILTNTMVCSPIKVVYFTDKGAQVPFFAGVITNVRVYTKDGHQAIEIAALSNTGTLDTMKVSKSCQNINTTYAGLMDSVAYQSGANMLYGVEEGAFADKLGTISIQYKETNWEYLKRLASHKYQGLFADMTVEAPVFSVGALGKEHTDVELQTCEYLKDIRSYETDNANYIQGIMEEDYVVLKAETYRILKLGDAIIHENKKYYIREATYEMRNGIVVASYLLCTKNGLKQRRIKNEKVQGLSINGTTMGVERDKVKIQLDIDSVSNAEYLFPYSTMSASPDGSGWYCMPQQGDLLRVYFPDEEEENCFAISSVSSYTPEAGAANDRMGDPNVRYLRTPDNKEVCLTPDGITISADDGQAVIRMDNAGNIIISGANSINMSATNDINISATRNVSVYAADTLKVSGQSGTITMDSSGNTRLTGQYVLEN